MTENQTTFGEKTNFIIALLATLLTLTFSSQSLPNWQISLLKNHYTLPELFAFMSFCLALSVYFYAINYLMLEEIKLVKPSQWARKAGNFLFAITILTPVGALIIHGVSQLYPYISPRLENYETILVATISLVIGLFGFWISDKLTNVLNKKQNKDIVESLENRQLNVLNEIELLYKQGIYTAAIMSMGKTIEIALHQRLAAASIDARYFGLQQMVALAQDRELINDKTYRKIKTIQNLRNRAAHEVISFTKKEAETALTLTKEVLEQLKVDLQI